jgi:uncharacterized Zn finger protein
MAIAAKRPDEVLHWYGELQAGGKRTPFGWPRYSGHEYSDRVAAAAADSHPERALAMLQRGRR